MTPEERAAWTKNYLEGPRLIEEVPGVEEYRWFLWFSHQTRTYFDSLEDGLDYCVMNGIFLIEEPEYFEP